MDCKSAATAWMENRKAMFLVVLKLQTAVTRIIYCHDCRLARFDILSSVNYSKNTNNKALVDICCFPAIIFFTWDAVIVGVWCVSVNPFSGSVVSCYWIWLGNQLLWIQGALHLEICQGQFVIYFVTWDAIIVCVWCVSMNPFSGSVVSCYWSWLGNQLLWIQDVLYLEMCRGLAHRCAACQCSCPSTRGMVSCRIEHDGGYHCLQW